MGSALYYSALLLQAVLLGTLLRNKHYRKFPDFTFYIAFCCGRSAVLFALDLIHHPAYAAVKGALRPLGLFLLVLTCGELLRLVYGRREWEWFAAMGALIPAVSLHLSCNVALDRGARWMTCLLLLCLLPGAKAMSPKIQAIAAGILVCNVFCAITDFPQLWCTPWIRYVPTGAFLIALAIWFPAFRKSEV